MQIGWETVVAISDEELENVTKSVSYDIRFEPSVKPEIGSTARLQSHYC